MLQSLLHFFTVLLGSGQGQDGTATNSASLMSSAVTATNSPYQSFDFLNTQANITSSTTARNFSNIKLSKDLEGSFYGIDQEKGTQRFAKSAPQEDSLKSCELYAKQKEMVPATEETVAAKIIREARPEKNDVPSLKSVVDTIDYSDQTQTRRGPEGGSKIGSKSPTDGTSQPATNAQGLFEMKKVKDAYESAVGGFKSQLKEIHDHLDVKGVADELKKKLLPFRQSRAPLPVDFSHLAMSPEVSGKSLFDNNVQSSFLNGPMPFYGGTEHDWRNHFAHSHSDGQPEHKTFISPHDHHDHHEDLHSRNAFEPITGKFSPSDEKSIKHLKFEYKPESKPTNSGRHFGTVAPTLLPKKNGKLDSLATRELDSFERAFSDKVLEAGNHDHPHGHLNFEDYFNHMHDHHHAVENTPQSYQSYDWTKILKSLVPSNNVQPPKTCTCTGDMKCCICSDGTCAAPGSCAGGACAAGGTCSGAGKAQTNVELDVVPVVLSPVIVNVFGTNKTGLSERVLKDAEEKVKAMILEKTMNESTLIKEVLGKSFPRLLINDKDKKPTVTNTNGGETEIHLNSASHERTR